MEQLKNMVIEIERSEETLNKIEMEVKELEEARLNKVIEIAKKGLSFGKIYENFTAYNNNNNWRDDEVTWFKGVDKKYIKGICVAENEINRNEDGYGGKVEKRRLFLMDDCSFKVFFKYSNWSNMQDCASEYKQSISKDQTVDGFDYDEIIDSIKQNLSDKLGKLGDRTKTQLERLEKLKKLEIIK